MQMRAVPVSAAVSFAILTAGFGFCLAANWPGHLSYDSVIQLLEGRTAVYANWHPPVMSWMLGLADAVVPGAALFVVFDALLVFGAFASLVLLGSRPSWAAPAAALVFCATPLLLIYPAIVWKDVLFAAAMVGGFACLAQAAHFWTRRRLRFGLVAAAFLLLVLAALARQNGILALLAGTVALGWIAWRQGGRAAGMGYGSGALAAALLLGFAAHTALAMRVTGDQGPASQIRFLQSYDLIGALAAEPGLPLSHLHAADPAAERAIRGDGVRLYSPQRNDTLSASPALMQALNDAPPAAVAADWRALILHRPGLYFATRWAAFRWVFLTPDLAACHPYVMGVDGPPAMMKALGLARRWDARDGALAAYAGLYAGTPFFSHAAYAVLAAVLLVLLLRRRRPADIAMAGLLAAAFLHTASFFVISIACDYRYLYALDLSALAAAFYCACAPGNLLPRRRP